MNFKLNVVLYKMCFTVGEGVIRLPHRVTLEHWGRFKSKGCMSGFILIYIKPSFCKPAFPTVKLIL